jgi:hypothetical protein
MMRYEEVKARSTTGLAHAVDEKSRLVLDVTLAPATVIVCETGVYVKGEEKPCLVVRLGRLTVKTINTDSGGSLVGQVLPSLSCFMHSVFD